MKVNFLDLKKQYSTIDMDTLMFNIRDLISSGGFVGGPHLDEFEEDFSDFCGSKYTVGAGSGTDALIFALAGLGIGAGDEVIVPANTFIATALAVTHVGATPVFADVDSDTYLITDKAAEKALTSKTKAIMPVHLYGNVCDMDKIMAFAKKNDLKVIEDCAQAIGATYDGKHVGTMGDAGCFSFYPAKNLGGLGQGGAIITNNEEIVEKARCLGNVGRKEGSWYEYSDVGYNSRLDAINALFLKEGLKHIKGWNAGRQQAAVWYQKYIKGAGVVKLPVHNPKAEHVYHLFEVKFETKGIRDFIQNKLKKNDIFAALHYPVPCHQQEVYKNIPMTVDLSVTEALADTLLSLPMHPFITETEVMRVCDVIKQGMEEIEVNELR